MTQEEKNSLLIPGSILLAGFVIAGGIYFSNKSNNPSPQNNQVAASNTDIKINPVSKDDYVRGNPDAQVAIVEFSDTECPFCKMFHTTMKSIIDTYGKDGRVSWVYRYFPLDSLHPKARKEAEALECVNEQGGSTAFWKMLDTIYANTPSNNGLDAAKLPEFAKEAGADVTKFNTCLASGKYAGKVEADFQDGVKAGAQGTPYSVLVLKSALSADAEKALQDYILSKGLAQNVIISSAKTEVVLSGALPVDMIKVVLNMVLK
jgi:protein-disulfide isomerase